MPKKTLHGVALLLVLLVDPVAVQASATVGAAPAEASVASAKWWLDRAESEVKSIASPREHAAVLSSLIRARAEAGDTEAANGLLQQLPKKLGQIERLRVMIARESIRRLVVSGKLNQAAEVVQRLGPPEGSNQVCYADLAVAQACAGDNEAATKTLATLNKDMCGRVGAAGVNALIGEGKLVQARDLAGRIPARELANGVADDFWKQNSIEHIAVAEAAGGDITEAIADVAGLSVHDSACQEVAAAAARNKNDMGAYEICESLGEQDRLVAYRYVAVAQANRDDIATALETVQKTDAFNRWIFDKDLAEIRVRLGRTDDAIRAVLDTSNPEILGITLNAMLQHKKFDAAKKLLESLPAKTSREGFDFIEYKIAAQRRIAGALADDDRLTEANKLMAEADAGAAAHPTRQNKSVPEEAVLALAAAELRAGDLASYGQSRKPYEDGVRAAAYAPSQRDARSSLLGFDLATHNVSAVEIDVRAWDADERSQNILTVGMAMNDPSWMEQGSKNLGDDRRFLALVLRLDRQLFVESIVNRIARLHADQSKLDDWFSWSQTLDSPDGRAEAEIAAAVAITKAPSAVEY